MMLTAKIAVNPLPWVLGPAGFNLSPATVTAAAPLSSTAAQAMPGCSKVGSAQDTRALIGATMPAPRRKRPRPLDRT